MHNDIKVNYPTHSSKIQTFASLCKLTSSFMALDMILSLQRGSVYLLALNKFRDINSKISIFLAVEDAARFN